METVSETRVTHAPGIEMESNPLYSIRWSAIFAGLAVGLGIHLLLMLIGVAAGFAVFGAGERPGGGTLSIAAAVWNTFSMLLSALIGGYVASRASGLRRNSDGMLHGVVSWGATVMAFAFITGSVTGNALGSLFGFTTTAATQAAATPGGPEASIPELLSSIQRGDRATTVQMLQERFGMTAEQANRAADQAATMIGRTRAPEGTESAAVTDTAQAATAASVWLSAAILLSLLAAAGGGLMGAHGAQRRATPHLQRRHTGDTTRVVRRQVPTAG
ncbi:hypothetical protein [Aromatoleum sp.]|uniref:hypothetical protein n=1 Tax=Aromatoleum sp. TaxID=2307007 RepID=UPI002FC900B3